jgi:hypothetical protein
VRKRPVFTLLALSVTMLPAFAQVYKCTDANGKIAYTSLPCGKTEKSQEIVVNNIPVTTSQQSERDWAKENQDFKQRQQDRDNKSHTTQPAWNANRSTSSGAGDQSLIAACEANHGIHCSSKATLDQIRRENTPITKSEQQAAIRERQEREREEAFNRAAGR